MANEQVTVRFAAEIQQYQTNVRQAQKLLQSFGISAEQEANRVAKSVASMAAQYASLTLALNAVKNVVKEGINFNAFMETSSAAFGTMMKSVSGAKALMVDLFNYAVNSPLTFKDTVVASKQLMAYGFAVKELIPTINMLGTVGKATGVSLADMSYVYGTLKSQGRAYTRDLMQFAMRGIPIYEELAKVMGVPVAQLQKMTEAGKIGFKEVEKAFQNMTTGSGKFAGFFEEYMKTFEGKMSMLSDLAQQASGTLTESLFNVLKKNVDDFIKILGNNKGQIAAIGTDLGKLASAFFDIVKALLPLLPLLLKLIPLLIAKEAISGGIRMWKALPEVFNAMGASIGLATNGLKALAAGGSFVPGMTSSMAMLGRATEGFATSLALIPKILVGILPELAAVAAGIALIAVGINKIKSDAAKASTDKVFAANELEKYMTSGRIGKGAAGMFGVNAESAQVSNMAKQFSLSKIQAAEVLLKVNEITKATYDQIVAETETLRIEQMRADNAKAYAEYNSEAAIALRAAQKAIVDEDAWKKAMAEFNKYKDDYEKWVASRSDDPYAVLEYEYNKNKQILQEKLGAYPKLYNTAVDWITKIYQYERDQIGATEAMKSKYGKYTGLIASSQTTVDKTFFPEQSSINQVQSALSEIDRTLAGEEDVYLENLRAQLSALLPLLQEIQRLSDKEMWKTVQNEITPPLSAWEEVVKKFNEYSDKLKGMDLTPKERADAEVALWQWQTREKAKITAEQNKKDTDQMIEGFKNAWDEIEAYRASLRADYNNATGGNSEYWKTQQENAGKMYASGNSVEGAASTLGMNTVQGSQMGNIIAGGDPLAQSAIALATFLTSIENVNKVLNPFTTILEGARGILEPLINGALQPLVNALTQIGYVVGQVLAPVFNLIGIVLDALVLYFDTTLLPILQIVGNVFEWLNNAIIVPMGNTLINVANGVIIAFNAMFGWLGLNISALTLLQTTTEALAATQSASVAKDALSATINYLSDKLSSMVDSQVKSLKDLYEVGAISASDYEAQVKAINDAYAPTDSSISAADQSLNTINTIAARLSDLQTVSDIIGGNDLTDAQIIAIAKAAGIATIASSSTVSDAIYSAIVSSGVSTTGISPTTSGLGDINNIVDLSTAGGAIVQGLVNGILNWGVSLWDGVSSFFIGLWDKFCEFFGIASPSTKFVGAGRNVVQGMINGIVNFGSSLWSNVATFFTSLWTNMCTFFTVGPNGTTASTDMNNIGSNIVQGMINGIKDAKIWDNVKDTFTSLWTNIQNIFSGVGTWFQTTFGAIADLLKIPFNNIIALFNSVINAMNCVKVTVPSWVPVIGGSSFGISIPTIATLATGTNYVPQDMLSIIHKGEKVIPETFSRAIDRGEVTLGNGSNNKGGDIYQITIEGSVTTERDLITAISKGITKQKKWGYA